MKNAGNEEIYYSIFPSEFSHKFRFYGVYLDIDLIFWTWDSTRIILVILAWVEYQFHRHPFWDWVSFLVLNFLFLLSRNLNQTTVKDIKNQLPKIRKAALIYPQLIESIVWLIRQILIWFLSCLVHKKSIQLDFQELFRCFRVL